MELVSLDWGFIVSFFASRDSRSGLLAYFDSRTDDPLIAAVYRFSQIE